DSSEAGSRDQGAFIHAAPAVLDAGFPAPNPWRHTMNDIERYGLRPNVAAALQADTGVPEERINLGELLHVLRKRKGTILGLTAGTIALTAVLTLLQHPIYEAKTQILVQLNKQQGLGSMDKSMPFLSSMMPDVGGFGAARSVGTEVEVLRSDTM